MRYPQKIYQSNDCSPICSADSQGNRIPIEDKDAVFDKAMRMLCDYWYTAKQSDKDDYIVCMKTAPADFSEDLTSPNTQWWAGRYIGQTYYLIPWTDKTTFQVDFSIRPRFGESFLLAIIEDLYGIKVINNNANDAQSPEWFSNLLNILRRRIWVEKCSKANRYGLPRVNVKQEHQGVTLRGALDVRRTIMPWLMKKEVGTYTYEKTLDDRICRIVYEAHRILSKDVVSNTVGKRKHEKTKSSTTIGFSMPPTVQDIINALNSQYKGSVFDLTENDYQRIRYKSIYLSWKPLVDFSWSVIRNRQLSYRASENQMDCVFVDMAEIWEAFLRKKLGEGLADEGWRVWSVEECHRTIYEKTFYKRVIIPDIVLQRGNEYIVFDAKYKRMRGEKKNAKDSDVDRADLFQIHTYIQYVQHHLGKVVLGGLLYPLEVDVDESAFHSKQLFGCDAKVDNNEPIPFIIDGIYCNEKEMNNNIAKEMENRVGDMINRIKRTLSNNFS